MRPPAQRPSLADASRNVKRRAAPLKSRGSPATRVPGTRQAARRDAEGTMSDRSWTVVGYEGGEKVFEQTIPVEFDRRERREGPAAAPGRARPVRGRTCVSVVPRLRAAQRASRRHRDRARAASASPPTRARRATTSRSSAKPPDRGRPSRSRDGRPHRIRFDAARARRAASPRPVDASPQMTTDAKAAPLYSPILLASCVDPARRLRHPRELRRLPDPDRRAFRLAARRLLAGDRHPEPRLGHRPADLRRARRALRRPPRHRARRRHLRPRPRAVGQRRRRPARCSSSRS